MAHVVSISERVRAFTGGLGAFEIEADNVGRLIHELERRFPGLGVHVEKNMAIAIDGEIHQDTITALLRPGSEVVLIPKISGG